MPKGNPGGYRIRGKPSSGVKPKSGGPMPAPQRKGTPAPPKPGRYAAPKRSTGPTRTTRYGKR